jgi:hypothetical protein
MTVLVLEDLVAEQGKHIALVEGAERFDGELDQCLEVRIHEGSNAHGCLSI